MWHFQRENKKRIAVQDIRIDCGLPPSLSHTYDRISPLMCPVNTHPSCDTTMRDARPLGIGATIGAFRVRFSKETSGEVRHQVS